MAGSDGDLEQAAKVFLRGPVQSGRPGVDIGGPADRTVGQVARRLSSCTPASIAEIRRAVAVFRSDPSVRARDAVIEAVTCAAAELPITKKES